MGRHKYRLTLNRRKAKRKPEKETHEPLPDKEENHLEHSTPVKKHRSDSQTIPLSPIQEVLSPHGESEDEGSALPFSRNDSGLSDSTDNCHNKSNSEFEKTFRNASSLTCSRHEVSFVNLCEKCGKYEDSKCTHDYSSGGLCEKCGLECLGSGTRTVTGRNETSNSELCDNDSLITLFTSVHTKLSEFGKEDFLVKLLRIIDSGRLDIEGLTFQMISDTVNALSVDSLTQMRFSWQSKCFWKLFLTKCGGMALRLLSGWKSIGTILAEECKRGCLDSDKSDIILAVPDEDVLKKFDPYDGEWPQKLPPGFSEKIAFKVAESVSVKESSVCLSLDGKKITPGLKHEKGDINLLGMEEDGPTLHERQRVFAQEQESISNIGQLIKEAGSTPREANLQSILQSLRWTLTLLSEKSVQLTAELEKKNYSLEKLKKMGGEDYKNSKYCFVIQQVIATQVELRECLETGCNLRHNLVNMLASLLKKLSMILVSPVCLSNLSNFYALHDIDSLQNSSVDFKRELAAFLLEQGPQYVKQRSEAWFSFRRAVNVTGSTLFSAVGANGLKAQREHFLQQKRGKQAPEFTQEAKDAMKHGEEHEIDALATFCTRFLPVYLPDCAIYEVGCFRLNAGNVPMLVSPDGMVTNLQTGKVEAVLEIKCPYTAKLHTSIPSRYYLQVQSEIMALDVDHCYFVSYKYDETRIFKISRDPEIWNLTVSCLQEVFGNGKDKVPSKLSENSKLLCKKIKTAVSLNCKLIAQVSSVSTTAPENPVLIPDMMTTHVCQDSPLPDIDMQWNVDKSFSTIETVSVNNGKIYQLLRKKATEVVTLVASDTDRIWSRDQVIGAPITYFLKGYSLSMSVMQSILEETMQKLHGIGMHVPCISFDGQFMKLVREDISGQPQTLLQLQKKHWQSVTKMSKAAIIAEFKATGVISSIGDLSLDRLSNSIKVGTKNNHPLPKTCLLYLSKLERGTEATESTAESPTESEDRNNHTTFCDDATSLEEILPSTFDNTDIAETELPDLVTEDIDDDDQQPSNDQESETENVMNLTHQNYVDLLTDFSNEFDAWNNRTIDEIKLFLSSCDQLCKLKIPELKMICRFLKHQLNFNITLSGTKFELLCKIKKLLGVKGTLVAPMRKRAIPSLSALAAHELQISTYPKAALNVSFAEWTFPGIVEQWRKNSKIKHDMIIPELNPTRPLNWFYIPEYSKVRNQLETKKIDTHHLLTRHRSALCKGNVGRSSRSHFIEVANYGKTSLKPGMMEQQLNMQSSDFARITFSEAVQTELEERGHHESAYLCKCVRGWFQSCDEPGISAVERCRLKLRYRDYLLSLVNLSSFPPPGSHIMGYSSALWEATIAAIDTDFIMYAITRRRTYNNRALGSQPCESLYSCLATMPGAKNGVPSCVDLEVNMAKICGECVVRQDPTRGFSARLSSAPVYPKFLLERDVGILPPPCKPPIFINQIQIQNHLFDSKERRRLTRQEPRGLTAPHEPGRGAVGVRHYHKVNECKLNPLIRAGISLSSQAETGVKI